MKTIGLIGGMSWESSAEYYRLINEEVKRRLGGFHSAKTLMLSVDFAEVEAMQREDAWDEAGDLLAEAGRRLEAGGAELVVLARTPCTGSRARSRPRSACRSSTSPTQPRPRSRRRGSRRRPARTRYTMEQDFYRGRMAERHGLDVLVPDDAGRTLVHDVIYEELVLGRIEAGSRTAYAEVIAKLVDGGAEAIVFGCTEIGLLVGPGDSPVPVFDTTRLHAEGAVELALA